jgi:hypothetical protein
MELAGELGFEPRFSESESDVLPLNYSPNFSARSASECRSAMLLVLQRRSPLGHLDPLSKYPTTARGLPTGAGGAQVGPRRGDACEDSPAIR